MDKEILKLLKKIHKSSEANNKVLKRIEKSLRTVKPSEDEKDNTSDVPIGNIKREWSPVDGATVTEFGGVLN